VGFYTIDLTILRPMLTILSLFGRSPFAPLQHHMDKVAACVECLPLIFEHWKQRDYDKVEALSKEICELEHAADVCKNEIRNNLPKSLFLPIDRGNLLEILSLQDSIADRAEDMAVLLTLRRLEPVDELHRLLVQFLEANLEVFREAAGIIREWQDLLESSFGGSEAQKVRQMIHNVCYGEHKVDLLQREVLRVLYNYEGLDYREWELWNRILFEVAGISNHAEKLANRVRMTLDLK
jgi:predicted phosphate transport protein (TIGR00153 family)